MDPGQQGKLVTLELYIPRMLKVEDNRICVVRLEDGIFGLNNICPHAGGALHAGYCNKKGIVTCPLHSYKFDVRNGESADGNNYAARTFKIEKREDGWYVEIK